MGHLRSIPEQIFSGILLTFYILFFLPVKWTLRFIKQFVVAVAHTVNKSLVKAAALPIVAYIIWLVTNTLS
ncbi:hypothetical protein CL653_01905 [bacterium]|nr:hypothetical protein [bacterium]